MFFIFTMCYNFLQITLKKGVYYDLKKLQRIQNYSGFTWKQFIVLLAVLYVGLCVLNYTNAQKSEETSNSSNLLEDDTPDYKGLFDRGSTPRNYLENGDFYSQGKPRRLGIDLSYIDEVETAIWWYDKVIKEFPGTQEANEALRAKIRTLIGWTDGYGSDKEYFGLRDRSNDKYFPIVEKTFSELETSFPNDQYLEALAYQIAQRYLFHVILV